MHDTTGFIDPEFISDEAEETIVEEEEKIDPRHERRMTLVQALFAQSFYAEQDQSEADPEVLATIASILEEAPTIDVVLQKFAPERPLSEINKVDLAILRLIVFESRHKKTPKKVLLDEAVELAKEFGTDSSSKFVNGVLGQLFASEAPISDAQEKKETL
ncbi:MAG: hypothetical protein M3Q81_02665 [bacterium]|nr:hypothetical protein [bacterium]